MNKIVITGATGMIGSALTRCALKEGVEVLCIVRKNSPRTKNLPQSSLLKIAYCDINEYCHFNFDGHYDILYHLAWDKTSGSSRDDVDIQTANIQYTLDAVRLAKRLGCKKFIGAGSQAEYGIVTEPLKPETPINPQSGYGIAKYTAGKLSGLLCSQLGLEFNWVRILSVFGPFDSAHTLIMYAIHELQAGRSPEFTKCEQIWDYLYCDDAAGALIAIGKNSISGKTYPLGSGEKRKLSDYLNTVRDIISPNTALQFGKKEYYPHQPMFLFADINEIINDTGWKPEVSFEAGIKKIINS
jgi:nucleoside-diphosphate-sugar epimerase